MLALTWFKWAITGKNDWWGIMRMMFSWYIYAILHLSNSIIFWYLWEVWIYSCQLCSEKYLKHSTHYWNTSPLSQAFASAKVHKDSNAMQCMAIFINYEKARTYNRTTSNQKLAWPPFTIMYLAWCQFPGIYLVE